MIDGDTFFPSQENFRNGKIDRVVMENSTRTEQWEIRFSSLINQKRGARVKGLTGLEHLEKINRIFRPASPGY